MLACSAFEPVPQRPVAAVSWSGGKDACVALHRARAEFDFAFAITMMDESGDRSRSHGLRRDVMQAQVDALGLRWLTRGCSWDSYEASFVDALHDARRHGVTHLVCGDILYPEHRDWVEQACRAASLTAVEPIFGSRTVDVYREFLALGGEARVVAIEASKLAPDWLFRRLDEASLASFADLGVDPCGENGEYHTLVTNCPAFSRPIAVEPGDHVLRSGYWAVDVRLEASR
jgi:diphthine-ammonia ligase